MSGIQLCPSEEGRTLCRRRRRHVLRVDNVMFWFLFVVIVVLVGSGGGSNDNHIKRWTIHMIQSPLVEAAVSSTGDNFHHRRRGSTSSNTKQPNNRFFLFPRQASPDLKKNEKYKVQDNSIKKRISRIDQLIDKAFYDSDVNHDGTISFQEAYEGVLHMYVVLNRQADIDPPSRYRVLQLYLEADATHNGRLNRPEFELLARRVTRRALLRVVVKKIITVIGAPALAEGFVRVMGRYKGTVEKIFRWIIPTQLQDHVLPVPLLTPAFHRSVWTIIFVATLGNICLSIVNFILDLSLPRDDEEETIRQLHRRGGKFRNILPK